MWRVAVAAVAQQTDNLAARDALADLLYEEAQYGPVVDERGAVTGVLSIEILSHALRTDPEEVPSGADAL